MSARLTASSSQLLRITSSPLSQNADYTVLLWFRLADISSDHDIFHFDPQQTGEHSAEDFFFDSAAGKLSIYAVDAAGSSYLFATGTTTLAANTWYFAAFRRSGSTIDIRLGTTSSAMANECSLTMAVSGRTNATRINMGAYSDEGTYQFYMNGRIYGVKMYSAALSNADIEAERLHIEQVRTTNTYDAWIFRQASETTGLVNSHVWNAVGTPTTEADPPITLYIPPATVSAGASVVAPTIRLGSLSLTPSVASAATAIVAPSVVAGAVSITPSPVSAATGVTNPTLIPKLGTFRLFLNTDVGAALPDAYGLSPSMEFTVDVDCHVTHIHYWRGGDDVTGMLEGGIFELGNSTPLATATFATGVGYGWQTVALSSPLAISAGTVYFVGVVFPDGHFSSIAGYFSSGPGASGVSYGILHAPSDAAAASGLGQEPFSFGVSTVTYPYSPASGASNYGIDVTVEVAPIVVSPDPATAACGVVDPTVAMSSLAITPDPASAVAATVTPAVILSAISITPDPASAATAVDLAAIILGSITLTPGVASAATSIIDPTVILGSLLIAPDVASAACTVGEPTVVMSGVTIAPGAASAACAVVDPTVVGSDIVIAPTPATASASTIDPTVALGSLVVIAAVATAAASTIDPSVILGSILIAPDAASARTGVGEPTVIGGGGVVIVPDPASARASVVAPTVIITTPPGPSPIPVGGYAIGGRGGASVGMRAGAQVTNRRNANVGRRRR